MTRILETKVFFSTKFERKSKKMNRILKQDAVSIPRRPAFIFATRILLRLISAVEEDIWQLPRVYFMFQFEVGWIQGKSFPSNRYAIGGDYARFTAFKSSFIDRERGEEEEVRVLKSFYYSVHEYLSPTELERLSTWLLMKLRNKRLRVV